MIKIGVHLRKLSQKQKTGVPLFWTILYFLSVIMTNICHNVAAGHWKYIS